MCQHSAGQKPVKDGPFAYTKFMQGQILGSFFYGYLISQVPAGYLATRFSGKWVLAVCYGISTIGTLLTPLAAKAHVGVLIAVRALVGLGSVSSSSHPSHPSFFPFHHLDPSPVVSCFFRVESSQRLTACWDSGHPHSNDHC